MKQPPGNIAFIITDVSSGGIVARLQKWMRELANRGHAIDVHTLHDRSGIYTPKIRPETFPHAQFIAHAYDSLDKSRLIIGEILADERLLNSRAIISSTFTRTGLLITELQNRSWHGCYIEVIPGEGDHVINPNRNNLDCCHVIAAVSRDIAEKLHTMFPMKPAVVTPGGVNILPLETQRTCPRIGMNPLRICYAGRMDPIQKRIFDLPAVAAGLERQGVSCQWILAGKGSHLNELKERFAAIQLTFDPQFTGHIDHHELRQLMTTCHVFVLPSAFEGLSNSLCEAAETGLVPIATRISGTSDVINHGINGYIVDVGDVEGISRHIAGLAADGNLWDRMSKAAREKAVNELSVSRSIDTILASIIEFEQSSASMPLASAPSMRHDSLDSCLESPWIPNRITRLTRKAWRAIRGRPHDVGAK